MKRGLIFAICLTFVFATFVQAADPPTSKPGPPKYFAKNASSGYKNKMAVASGKLKKMEDRLDKIDKDKKFSKKDMDDMNTNLDEYGNDMHNLYNEAVDRVKEADKTKGKSGGNEEFLYFEEESQAHVKRMNALKEKHQKIDKEVKDGKIKPDKDTVDKMTPQERKEFMNSLSPEGKKEIEKAYPKMKSTSTIMDFPFASLSSQGTILNTFSTENICSNVSGAIANFFIPSAEALIAYQCYGTCAATIGLGCIYCILRGGVDVVNAYKSWRSCMNSCGCHWYSFWCCVKKTACTAWFIARLA